jgi:hypothetical protein
MARLVVVSFVIVSLSGCAILIRGAHVPVQFASDPPGAEVKVDTGKKPTTCTAPCTLDLARSRTPLSYSVTMNGYEPYTAELIPSPDDTQIWYLWPVAVVDGLMVVPGLIDIACAVGMDWPTAVHVMLPPEGHGGARAVVTR